MAPAGVMTGDAFARCGVFYFSYNGKRSDPKEGRLGQPKDARKHWQYINIKVQKANQ